MSPNEAWRGERRLRVAIEMRERSVHVRGLTMLEGPAVQRRSLGQDYVAQVSVGGIVALYQAFDDPLTVRGVAPAGQIGHSFGRRESGLVNIDVPLPAGSVPTQIAIKIVDLSHVTERGTNPDAVRTLLSGHAPAGRVVAELTDADLAQHPDWGTLGLANTIVSAAGSYEIYVDRAGQYRWRLRRPDGEIVADSGQGYSTRAACEADLQWVKQHAGTAATRALDTP